MLDSHDRLTVSGSVEADRPRNCGYVIRGPRHAAIPECRWSEVGMTVSPTKRAVNRRCAVPRSAIEGAGDHADPSGGQPLASSLLQAARSSDRVPVRPEICENKATGDKPGLGAGRRCRTRVGLQSTTRGSRPRATGSTSTDAA
ncbi:hypothetical protein Maq22A_1p38305 (plasmid) [Methylobacterium aquaticum]|uniref:Uncharacterized protein n=1 Tax=Methylobacterium aquaticum TaxID=270351 RepID=A0A1Y0Z8W5_9HYPH|nr:hypothetical protein Maq22A_1p38305 [Methylobacterium aquaticum]